MNRCHSTPSSRLSSIDFNDRRKVLVPPHILTGDLSKHLDRFSQGLGLNPLRLAMLSGDVV